MSDAAKRYTPEALFGEEEASGFDHTDAYQVLDNRSRFEALDDEAKAEFAGSMAGINAMLLGVVDASAEVVNLEIQRFIDKTLTFAEAMARVRATSCAICSDEVDTAKPFLESQFIWVAAGTNQVVHRIPRSRIACVACIERVKDGGGAEEPMF